MCSLTRCGAVLGLIVTVAWLTGCGGGGDGIPAAVGAGDGTVSAGTGSVTGRVVDVADAQPIAGTTVFVDDVIAVRTASDGTFLIENIAIGTHMLRVDGAGYASPDGGTEIDVDSGMNDLGDVVVRPDDHVPPPQVPQF